MSKYTDPDPQFINEPQMMGEYTFPMYPIKYALLKSDPEMLKRFIDAGADPNTDFRDGLPILHEAVDYALDSMVQARREKFFPEILEIIKILVENGADFEKESIRGDKPFDVINAYASNKKVFDMLVDLFRPAIPFIDDLVIYKNDL